jgi:hypothetical protein
MRIRPTVAVSWPKATLTQIMDIAEAHNQSVAEVESNDMAQRLSYALHRAKKWYDGRYVIRVQGTRVLVSKSQEPRVEVKAEACGKNAEPRKNVEPRK